MRNFFAKIRQKLAFCYGTDDLNKLLNIITIIICVISLITGLAFLSFFALILLIYTTYRTFSKNIYKRRAENEKLLSLKRKWKKKRSFKKMVRKERKDFLYFKCPKCKEYLRVPRGKGAIVVTCRVCGAKIDKKT